MSVDLRAVAHQMYDEVISGGNLDLIDEIVHEDFVEHEEMPGVPTDKEAPRVFVSLMRAGFPDLRATIEDIVQEGETIVVRARMSGTHDGEFMGIPPTGRSVDFAAFDMVRFSDGKAIEHWGLTDTLAMMQQLGVIPEDPPG
ncbi:MAG: ester cyclase [Gaiellales bacterium]